MTPAQALTFVRKHGVVLASGKGPVPNLAELVAGESIAGSWWAHPKGREIFRILTAVSESNEVLVCRLVIGKITYVHRRLWPALARSAGHFSAKQLAKTQQEHADKGHHLSHDIPYPDWVPPEVLQEAEQYSESAALTALGAWAGSSRHR